MSKKKTDIYFRIRINNRKNWLFSNTANGANASATLYSIIETAKANGLVPYDYLNYLLNEIPSLKPGDNIDHLLPWEYNKQKAVFRRPSRTFIQFFLEQPYWYALTKTMK
jgi:hypothetical protein